MSDQDLDLERKLVTILSADVAGYSRLMAEDEDQTLRTFREHRLVVDQLVKLHRGRIFNTAGDAFLVEFNSAVEAVRCATEIQAALRTRNEKLPENRQVQFRIGVNLGDVLIQGTDLLGDGVNIAARLQTAASPGGVCISGSVYDQIATKLSLEVLSMGERSYKNIPQPVRTFSVSPGLVTGHARVPSRSWRIRAVAATFLTLAICAGFAFSHVKFRVLPLGLQISAKKAIQVPEPLLIPYLAPASSSPARVTAGNGKTIGAALAEASPNDIIDVLPGTYREHLEIKKHVTLRGLSTANGKLGVTIENEGTEVINVASSTVSLENLVLIQHGTADTQQTAALLLQSGKISLRNVAVFSAGEFASNAITILDAEVTAENSSFTGKRGIDQMGGKLRCTDCTTNGNLEEGAVIMNQARASGMVSDFKNYQSSRNGFHGIAVMDGVLVHLSHCQLNENGLTGAEVIHDGKAEFQNCEVNHNGDNGVLAADKAAVDFSAGTLDQNKFNGAAARDSANLVVRKSTLSGNSEFGFALVDNAKGANENNKLEGNKFGRVYRGPASK